MSTSFRTRKRGTSRQIGKKFPIMQKRPLPRLVLPSVESQIAFMKGQIKRMKRQQKRVLREAGGEEEVYFALKDRISMLEDDIKELEKKPTGLIRSLSDARLHVIFKDLQKQLGVKSGDIDPLWQMKFQERLKKGMTPSQVRKEAERYYEPSF